MSKRNNKSAPVADASTSAATATALPAGHVLIGGVAVAVAPSIAKRAASLANLPEKYRAVVYTGNPAKPTPRASGTNSVAGWAAVSKFLAENGGKATGAELAAASTGDFTRFAIKAQWVVAQAQEVSAS